jgi:hypothetical protein
LKFSKNHISNYFIILVAFLETYIFKREMAIEGYFDTYENYISKFKEVELKSLEMYM